MKLSSLAIALWTFSSLSENISASPTNIRGGSYAGSVDVLCVPDQYSLETTRTMMTMKSIAKSTKLTICSAIEGRIGEMLKHVGIRVNTHKLPKDDYNAAEQAGDFHLSFSETWGAPYEGHGRSNRSRTLCPN